MKLKSTDFRLKSIKNHFQWYLTRTYSLGTEYRNLIFKLLRGGLSGWASSGKLFTYLKICTRIVLGGDGANMVRNEKLTRNLKLRGLKLRGLSKTLTISLILFDQHKKYTNLTNLIGKHQRIWASPTHFQKVRKN